MAESLVVLAQAFRAALVSFQPEMHSGEDCAAVVEELALVENVSAVTRVDAALRVKECGTHRERGFAHVTDWMARVTGSTASSAKAALQTVAALESQPEARAALEAGELSFGQVRELIRTEAEVPGSTAELLDVARSESFRTLKEKARDRRVRAIDPEELHARQHAAMSHRTWINALGNVAYAGELPPELGIPFKNVLDAETDRLWLKEYQNAKHRGDADGKELRRSALAAQAFVRMVENGGGKGKSNRADMVIVCDLDAYRRGHTHKGEPCHIIGGGPIPVALAKELGRDAFLKAVLHTGTELHTIAHFGRRYPAVLQTALDLGAPPDFNGNVCAVPGCDRCYHLQRDHIDPVANGGLTSYVNNQPLCPTDHRIKTEQDRKAGLLSRTGPRGPDPKHARPNRNNSPPRSSLNGRSAALRTGPFTSPDDATSPTRTLTTQ